MVFKMNSYDENIEVTNAFWKHMLLGKRLSTCVDNSKYSNNTAAVGLFCIFRHIIHCQIFVYAQNYSVILINKETGD